MFHWLDTPSFMRLIIVVLGAFALGIVLGLAQARKPAVGPPIEIVKTECPQLTCPDCPPPTVMKVEVVKWRTRFLRTFDK